MKKYVIMSVDNNPQYLFYLPLVAFAWRSFGWIPVMLYVDVPVKMQTRNRYIHWWDIKTIPGYRSETMAQVSRLYAACLPFIEDGDMVMTSDVDMLPLSNYWVPNPDLVTTYGHDLTGHQHVPMCYVAATKERWKKIMGMKHPDWDIEQILAIDLMLMPNARAETPQERRWVVDQDLLTHRISQYKVDGNIVENVARGTLANGYPIGRVDRSAWTMDHQRLIDCHMYRDIFNDTNARIDTLYLLQTVWPDEDWSWVLTYITDFKRVYEV